LGSNESDIDRIKKHRFFRKIDWKALEARQVAPPIIPAMVKKFPHQYHIFFIVTLGANSFSLVRLIQKTQRTLIANLPKNYPSNLLPIPLAP
jgi:hypothetical protein